MHEAAVRHNILSLFYPTSPSVLPPPILLALAMSSADYPSPHSSPSTPSISIGILPPLPKIRSGQIRKRIFTHSSLAGESRYDFQAPESDPSADNEEYVHCYLARLII